MKLLFHSCMLLYFGKLQACTLESYKHMELVFCVEFRVCHVFYCALKLVYCVRF